MPCAVWRDNGHFPRDDFLMPRLQVYTLPVNAACCRTLGPWNTNEIPAGLKGQHQLKAGSWAVTKMLSGKIDFAWDDESAKPAITLKAGMELTVPPLVLHHMVLNGPVKISLSFYREVAAA